MQQIKHQTLPLAVCAAIIHHQGKILLTQRPTDKPHAGFWEFPGGKIEPGESPHQSLRREINEELDIVIFYTSKTVSVLDNKDIASSKQVGSTTVMSPLVNGQTLTFKKTRKGFTDDQTGSLWNITGNCISGKLKGEELRPVIHGNHFAFAWFAFYPESEIYE